MDDTTDERIDDVMETPALSPVETAVSITPTIDPHRSLATAGATANEAAAPIPVPEIPRNEKHEHPQTERVYD